jgi:hypothetical protein
MILSEAIVFFVKKNYQIVANNIKGNSITSLE